MRRLDLAAAADSRPLMGRKCPPAFRWRKAKSAPLRSRCKIRTAEQEAESGRCGALRKPAAGPVLSVGIWRWNHLARRRLSRERSDMRDSHRAGAAKAEGRNIRGQLAGPGCCPPEAYCVCCPLYYDRHMVTVSRDSTNPFGYRELAIGPFEARRTLCYQCKRLVPPIPWE